MKFKEIIIKIDGFIRAAVSELPIIPDVVFKASIILTLLNYWHAEVAASSSLSKFFILFFFIYLVFTQIAGLNSYKVKRWIKILFGSKNDDEVD